MKNIRIEWIALGSAPGLLLGRMLENMSLGLTLGTSSVHLPDYSKNEATK